MGSDGMTDGDVHPPLAPTPTLYLEDTLRLVGLAVFAIAVLIVVVSDWESPIRVALVVAFLLVGPGLALAELLEIEDPVHRLALAGGAGLALETLVAAALLYAGAFSATAACGIVVAFTCLALLGAAWRRSGAVT